MRAPRSLRARLTLAALLAVAIGGTIAGGLLLAAVERDGRRAIDGALRQQVAEVLRGPPGDRPSRDGRRGPDRLLAGSGTFVQVAFGDEVVAQRGDVPADAPPPPEQVGYATVDIGGRAWRSLTVSFAGSTGQRLQVLSTLAPVEARVGNIRRLILLLGLLALALTGLAAWAFTSLAIRPLARLQEGAARVSGAEDLRTPCLLYTSPSPRD